MNLIPIILIVIGIVVLILGRRLAILGAAVGALIGFLILQLFPSISELGTQLLVIFGLALAGFFATAFARGIIEIVILVIGTLAGAGIVRGILNLFNLDLGLLGWLLVVVGAVIGFMLMRRARRGSRDWGMVILASLVGALLIGRGLTQLIPALQDTLIITILLVVAVAFGIIFQGGYLDKFTSSKKTATPPPPPSAGPTTPGSAPPSSGE